MTYAHCFASWNCPPLNGPVHVFVPEYVPVMAELVMFGAEPAIVALQLGNAVIAPTGTAIVKLREVPERLADRFPVNEIPPTTVAAFTVPVTD